jgi:hypothetical protein
MRYINIVIVVSVLIVREDNVKNLESVENHKPNKNDSILSHGALMCKTCSALWNRYENSGRNIYKIALYAIHKKERPEYLSSSNQTSFVGLKMRKL